MKNKLFLFTALLAAFALPRTALAYDFSAVSPSGHTLYYNIVNGYAEVTYQQTNEWGWRPLPSNLSGALEIPSNVVYNGTTYSVTSIGNGAFFCGYGLTSVTIPNSVTSIGDEAFKSCTGLTSVTIPNSVTSIGNDAFFHCSGLTSVVIPNSVTNIGLYAFDLVNNIIYYGSATGSPWGAKTLNGFIEDDFVYSDSTKTTVTGYVEYDSLISIPSMVTSIGDYAFYGCRGLKSVVIPNSVTSIGFEAFFGCTDLTSVVIPSSVTSIGDWAFHYVNNIIYFGSATGSPWGAKNLNGFVENGLVFSDSTKTTVTGYVGLDSVVIIPNTVTSIGDYAFYSCTGHISVTIGNSVTSIGYGAFESCSGLTSVSIGNSVTSIGIRAFYNCTELDSITVGSGLVAIGTNAFETYTNTYDYTFIYPSYLSYNCNDTILGAIGKDSLTTVIIGDSVTSIGNSAFSYCTGLTSVTIGNSVTSIGTEAFCDCSGLTSVVIPNSVSSIGVRAFLLCSSLTSVEIPNSVTSIGDEAFRDCSGLTSVSIGNSVTSIGIRAFYNCTELDSITVGSGLVAIGAYAFTNAYPSYLCYNCNANITGAISKNNLVTVIIGDSVTVIANSAFYHFWGLQYVHIGNSVTSIGNDAFYGCSSLTSVEIPNSVTSIGNDAFSHCSGLTSVSIPNLVTSIGNSAFFCSGLTSVSIGNSATTIGDFAFYGCSGLTSVEIPNSVTSIGNHAFEACNGLDSITVGDGLVSIGTDAFTNAHPIYLYYNCNANIPGAIGKDSLTTVIIGDLVETINAWAFENCPRLKKITIPLGITSIGCGAFQNCVSLDSVFFNADSCEDMGCWPNVFENDSVKYIEFGNSVRRVPGWIMQNIGSLSKVVLGDSVVTIGERAFENCTGLDSIVIPDAITVIANNAFENDSNLRYVSIIGNSVTSIGNSAFRNCVSMDSIVIPDAVTIIASNAFENDSSLRYVSIGNSVTSIGNHAFSGCDSLYSIWMMPETPPSLEYMAFNGSRQLTFHIPCGTYAAYQSAWENIWWTDYDFIYIEPDAGLEMEVATDNATMGTATIIQHYGNDVACDSTAVVNAIPAYGYHFDHWSNGSTANPYTLHLVGDSSVTAYFGINQYTLTVMPNDTALGTVTGGGTFLYLDTATITATCTAEHYHFEGWSDGVTSEVRTIVMRENMMLTAIFSVDIHYVDVVPSDGGEFYGTGEYEYGSTAEVWAEANYGYYFMNWNDGSTDNPAVFTVTGDTTLSATFGFAGYVETPSICMVNVYDNQNVVIWNKIDGVMQYNIYREGGITDQYDLVGTVSADEESAWYDQNSRPMSRSYRYKMTTSNIFGEESDFSEVHKTMHLTINKGQGNAWNLIWTEYEGADFVSYLFYRGTSWDDLELIDQMPVGGYTTYTDYDAPEGDVYYRVDVLKATPCDITKNHPYIRSNVATNGPVGIGEVSGDGVAVYAADGRIVVTGSEGETVRVYDMIGREVAVSAIEYEVAYVPMPASGVYLVKIGDRPARRVVVVR